MSSELNFRFEDYLHEDYLHEDVNTGNNDPYSFEPHFSNFHMLHRATDDSDVGTGNFDTATSNFDTAIGNFDTVTDDSDVVTGNFDADGCDALDPTIPALDAANALRLSQSGRPGSDGALNQLLIADHSESGLGTPIGTGGSE